MIRLRISRNLGYVFKPYSKWGGLLSLNGSKEMNYNQLYKNDPYTSNLNHGRKTQISDVETNITIGFISRNCIKMTINLSNSDTSTSGPQRNLFSI